MTTTDVDTRAVKLLLEYDPAADKREDYFHFMLGEFVPALEHLGLTMCEIWHTAYGDYPLRLTGFMASDRGTLDEILSSDDFYKLESRLLDYVVNYERRIVPLSSHFQF